MANPDTAELLDMMPSTVFVRPLLRRDVYGAPTYGDPVPYRAHVSNKSTLIRGDNGELVATKGSVWLATSDAISSKSQMTLPDGTVPVILAVNATDDETGEALGTRVDFG